MPTRLGSEEEYLQMDMEKSKLLENAKTEQLTIVNLWQQLSREYYFSPCPFSWQHCPEFASKVWTEKYRISNWIHCVVLLPSCVFRSSRVFAKPVQCSEERSCVACYLWLSGNHEYFDIFYICHMDFNGFWGSKFTTHHRCSEEWFYMWMIIWRETKRTKPCITGIMSVRCDLNFSASVIF